MTTTNHVSLSDFAKLVGAPVSTVQRKIAQGWLGGAARQDEAGRWLIDPVAGAAAWRNVPRQHQARQSARRPPEPARPAHPAAPGPRPFDVRLSLAPGRLIVSFELGTFAAGVAEAGGLLDEALRRVTQDRWLATVINSLNASIDEEVPIESIPEWWRDLGRQAATGKFEDDDDAE